MRGLVELALSFQVLNGLSKCVRRRHEVGTEKPNRDRCGIGALERAVERGGQQRTGRLDGHAPANAVFAAGPTGMDQPDVDLVLVDVVAQQFGIDRRDSASGTARRTVQLQLTPTRPFSVPAIPRRIAGGDVVHHLVGVSLAIAGVTP